MLLEGAAKGEEHKYLYKDFTVTEPATVDPPEAPPLPPLSMPPVAEGTTEAAASVSEAAAVAASVSEAAAVAASAAIAQQEDDISAAFMQVFES